MQRSSTFSASDPSQTNLLDSLNSVFRDLEAVRRENEHLVAQLTAARDRNDQLQRTLDQVRAIIDSRRSDDSEDAVTSPRRLRFVAGVRGKWKEKCPKPESIFRFHGGGGVSDVAQRRSSDIS